MNQINFTGALSWRVILEIILLSFLTYYFLLPLKGTRALTVLKGLIAVFLVLLIFKAFGLTTISWIIEKALIIAPFAIIIVFQPELRSIFERAGRGATLVPLLSPRERRKEKLITEEVVQAASELAKNKEGALIAIVTAGEIPEESVVRGEAIDAELSARLLLSLFHPGNPLHDGAVIIRDGRLDYANCFFPLSQKGGPDKTLGTRHLAAIGISELAEVAAVVVSEETGSISIAHHGRIARDLSIRQLRDQLEILLSDRSHVASVLR